MGKSTIVTFDRMYLNENDSIKLPNVSKKPLLCVEQNCNYVGRGLRDGHQLEAYIGQKSLNIHTVVYALSGCARYKSEKP